MMEWDRLLSTKRFGQEDYHNPAQQDRTEFQRDYDRLIFSAPFRRLQNKTQVFPLPGNIFVHNRLTHSLEVSCVGRSLGSKVSRSLATKYNVGAEALMQNIGDIVSAGCLAHDMGNPPLDIREKRPFHRIFRKETACLSSRNMVSPTASGMTLSILRVMPMLSACSLTSSEVIVRADLS